MFDRAGRYVTAAFSNRWNLLFFSAGVAASLISPIPLVLLPLVAAGEVLYLASLVSNDRFRAAVDAADHKARKEADSQGVRETYDRIREQLPKPLLKRFDQLRAHCQKLVELAGSLRAPGATGKDGASLESLERLLWGHLRMIWNAAKLSEFLEHTDDESIRHRISDLEHRLAALPEDAASVPLRTTLEDHLRTSRDRLSNIDEARRKLDVVTAEIERLEAKIAALAEGAVTRRDLTDIASRVDEVAEGMRRADETMRQLELPPDLEEFEEPPQLLREEA